jgi:N-acetylglucosaminyldiphosphoundecaprenol N-acetyl-beta-D-mannosaminyltransferase
VVVAETENGGIRGRLPFRLRRRPEERVILLGQPMDLVKSEEVLNFIAVNVEHGRGAIIANHNAHSLYLLRISGALRAFYGLADLVEVDSVPLLLWARFSGRNSSRRFHRCTYLDWRTAFWSIAANRSWRVFYLGAAPGVAMVAAERIRQEFPGTIVAVHDGFFDVAAEGPDNRRVLAAISEFQPQVVMVGMGMPRQEKWIAQNVDALEGCVVLSVGAAFDYEAGVQKAAPRWIGRLGLEWLYRLVADPRRLFRRYCIEPWALLLMLAQDWREVRKARPTISKSERRSAVSRPENATRRRASDLRGSVDKAEYPPELLQPPIAEERTDH